MEFRTFHPRGQLKEFLLGKIGMVAIFIYYTILGVIKDVFPCYWKQFSINKRKRNLVCAKFMTMPKCWWGEENFCKSFQCRFCQEIKTNEKPISTTVRLSKTLKPLPCIIVKLAFMLQQTHQNKPSLRDYTKPSLRDYTKIFFTEIRWVCSFFFFLRKKRRQKQTSSSIG